jgi:hypothetical protein
MRCPGWPDVDCSEGRTARDFLNEVIARADSLHGAGARDVRAAAAALRDRRDPRLGCEELCAKVYAAHAAVLESPPSWTLALQALSDPEAVPEAAAALTSGPTVVAEATPSRARSPRPPRPPAKRKAKPKAKASPKGRAKTPAKPVGSKAKASTRRRETARRRKKTRGSRSSPRKRNRR